MSNHVYTYIAKASKDSNPCWGWPKGSIFNSYHNEVYGRALLLSRDCSTLPSIRTFYCWVLNKEVSIIMFKVFGMMRTGIEPKSTEPLANTLPTRLMKIYMIKFGWVLYHNNYCRIFKAKSSLYLRGSLNKFPDFFRMGSFFLQYTHGTQVTFKVISSGCNAFVVRFLHLLECPMEVLLCERVSDLRHSLFHLINFS